MRRIETHRFEEQPVNFLQLYHHDGDDDDDVDDVDDDNAATLKLK